MHYYELIGLTVLYILVRTIKKESYTAVFSIIILAGIIQAVYGKLQLYGIYPSHHNLFSLTGGFLNPGPYAGYLITVLPVALAFYLFTIPGGFQNIQVSLNNEKKNGTRKPDDQTSEIVSNSQIVKFFPSISFTSLQIYIIKYIAITAIIAILLVLPATKSRAGWLAAMISTSWLLAVRNEYDLAGMYNLYLKSPFKKVLALIVVVALMSGLLGGGVTPFFR